ncbi:hypothetical protein ACLQ3B_04745 [Micromonospora sp. DT53]|uniref:hypothetical protein n=1 Tax=Micromonospora sp. DT53 TaxID=3393444 RepID=UPI003CF4E869
MFEPGSRSKQVSTFMLPEDEAAFDEALGPAIAGLGQWETHDQRARSISLHDSLPVAMCHDRTQAFLRLLGRDGETLGPLIQYLRTSVVTTDEAVLAFTGGRYRATAERPEAMSPGRLAFKWFPEDEADCVRRDFVLLAGMAWKALQAVTSPHIDTVAGRPLRRYRVGVAAKGWALGRPGLQLHDYALRLRIRPGMPPTVRGSSGHRSC